MPNYVYCHARIVGSKKAIGALRVAFGCLGDEAASPAERAGKKIDAQARYAAVFKELSTPYFPPEEMGLWGSRAGEVSGRFSFQLDTPMPMSLGVESGSEGSLGLEALAGNWRDAMRSPWLTKELLALSPELPGTREAFIELLRKARPRAIELGEIQRENVRLYGCPTWYEWSTKNWGTKWDAGDVGEMRMSADGRMLSFYFQTAWSPPMPALKKLAKARGVSIALSYQDEGGGFSGVSKITPEGSAEDIFDADGRKKGLKGALAALARDLHEQAKSAEPGNAERPHPVMRALEKGLSAGSMDWEKALAKGKALCEGVSNEAALFQFLHEARAKNARPEAAESARHEWALEWLNALLEQGYVSARGKIEYPRASVPGARAQAPELWEAICHAAWVPGAISICERLRQSGEPGLADKGMIEAMAVSLLGNRGEAVALLAKVMEAGLLPGAEHVKVIEACPMAWASLAIHADMSEPLVASIEGALRKRHEFLASHSGASPQSQRALATLGALRERQALEAAASQSALKALSARARSI